MAPKPERPTWSWINNLTVPSVLSVEPSFKPELGLVFIRIDQDGQHKGIWLDRPTLTAFISAVKCAANWAEYDDPDLDV